MLAWLAIVVPPVPALTVARSVRVAPAPFARLPAFHTLVLFE